MTPQNYYAVLGMCAIVIVCYALRNSEAHYLPDLIGLALALAAPHQSMALAAWLIFVLIRHTPIGYGLAADMPSWLLVIVLPRAARYMSIQNDESIALEQAYNERILDEESRARNGEIPQRVAENYDELITSAENRMLARLVAAGAIGKTDAIKIGAGVKSGDRYSARTRAVQSEVNALLERYPELTQEKKRKPKRANK